jgi:hypothetical protein
LRIGNQLENDRVLSQSAIKTGLLALALQREFEVVKHAGIQWTIEFAALARKCAAGRARRRVRKIAMGSTRVLVK